jgi:hypothetical protein
LQENKMHRLSSVTTAWLLLLGLMLAAADAIGQQETSKDQPPSTTGPSDAKEQAPSADRPSDRKDQPPMPNPLDGRIVRVVYSFTSGGTWGFHLAHMTDGRYCVRFGDPGRLRLAIIAQVADICFDRIPGKVERTGESRSQAIDVNTGKQITVARYQMGSIARTGNDIVLDITTCSRVEGVDKEGPCSSQPSRYMVRFTGRGCIARVTGPDARRPGGGIGGIICVHDAAN